MENTYTKVELQQMVDAVGQWWHSIEFGQGIVTPGVKPHEQLIEEVASFRLPDLAGKTVLDIGAYDGFFSFEAERRNAARVVALDHYVWSLDLPNVFAYWRECKERGIAPKLYDETPYWQPDKLPGQHGFNTAHKALQSKVEPIVADFMTVDPKSLGTFDVVLFLGVLYHMENPMLSLRRLAALTREMAIVETQAVFLPDYEDSEICEFYSSAQLNNDSSNWWAPNAKALVGMCRAAGFSRVELVSKPPGVFDPPTTFSGKVRRAAGDLRRAAGRLRQKLSGGPQPMMPYRAVVHAWK